jgi:hypothetical protein
MISLWVAIVNGPVLLTLCPGRLFSGTSRSSRPNSSFLRGVGSACACQGVRGVPLGMSRTRPENLGSGPPDWSVAADVLLRQEPDEEEDEEEDEGDGKKKEDDDDDDTDGGYSE